MTDRTKICKHCKSVIKADASVCPHCRQRQSLSCLSCLGCLICMVIIVPILVNMLRPKDSDTDSTTSPVIWSVTATDLIQAFEDDQVIFGKVYIGNSIKVSGKVADIRKEFDQTYVCLGNDSSFVQVRCRAHWIAATKMSQLEKGDDVIVHGEVSDCTSLFIDITGATLESASRKWYR
ncbi:MAG: OB-fold protein [Thermoguttaceae bacterium]